MGDWADEKAEEFFRKTQIVINGQEDLASLAALLRDVVPTPAEEQEYRDRERARVLAEVLRVVEEIANRQYFDQGRMAREIVSCLEKLK